MPELPEAQTIASQLDRCVRGAVVCAVRVRCRKMVRANGCSLSSVLVGRRIAEVTRRGKRVVMRLFPDATLVFRLGMTGQIMVTPTEQPRDRHVQVRLGLDGGERELRFRDVRKFGSVWFSDNVLDDSAGGIDGLGPDPLELTPRDFARLLKRNRQIKALLLDQNSIAGLGNIYCDEALFAAGIHPLTRASDVDPDRVRRLGRAIRRVLTEAIAAGGSTLRDYRTATGEEGRFQIYHRVYGREGEACLRCGASVIRIQAAGRSSHVCLLCQPVAQSGLRPQPTYGTGCQRCATAR